MRTFGVAFAKRWLAALAVVLGVLVSAVSPAEAAGDTRSLKLYFVHTGEKATITFKRNGKFDPKGLQELNRFLRDWRRNEPTRMDPRLFDLVWSVYNKVGASDYIHVVSGYRSPTTNAMLRSRTKGVAEQSQHMRGKAMDFFIPGIPLKTLRETAMRYQRGGVGFYPTSRSPFVHLDVAGVRAWPRMARQDLVRLFPDGKTLHIPADGTPLPGYEQALAEFKARGEEQIVIDGGNKPKRPNLLAFLFGGGDEDENADEIAAPEDNAPAKPAVAAPAVQTANAALPGVTTGGAPVAAPGVAAAPNAPVPATRPALAAQQGTLMSALTPPAGTSGAANALQAVQQEAQPGFADLGNYKIPVPSLLSRDTLPAAELAYVPVPVLRPQTAETAALLPATVPVPNQQPVAVASAPQATTLVDPEAADDMAEEDFAPSDAATPAAANAQKLPMPASTMTAPARPTAILTAAPTETPVKMAKASRVAAPAAPIAKPVEAVREVPVYRFDPARF